MAYLQAQHGHVTILSNLPVGAQNPQTLFPCAGDEIHPALRNRGLVYETIVNHTGVALFQVPTHI